MEKKVEAQLRRSLMAIPSTIKRVVVAKLHSPFLGCTGDAEGVQLGFAESLQEHIVRLQKNGEINDGETIKIKLSGDGTNIGKGLTVVNFTFTILHEKDVAMGVKGNYILAVIKTTETYDNLRDSLADLRMEMSNLKEISANNCTYKIEYFLDGDLKFFFGRQ